MMKKLFLLCFMLFSFNYAVEYECIEYLGDYKVVFKGTRDAARRVSDKRYTSSASCNRDLDNYLNGVKTPVEYECIEYLGDYKIVFKGTKDAARRVSDKSYTSSTSCNLALDNYLNGVKAPVEYECIEHLGDYKIVFKGTKDAARRVSSKRYSSSKACKIDLDNYLNGTKAPAEYECIEYLGDYKIVFKGTKDAARRVSDKRYTSSASCNRDLDNYLNGVKTPVEYECIEYLGDYKIVFKGTKDAARRVSSKRYTSQRYCEQDLEDYLARRK